MSENVLPLATLTAASIRESLASGKDAFKVGPIRVSGEYHGRLLTDFANVDVAKHAAHILASCDGYLTELAQDGQAVSVIARRR